MVKLTDDVKLESKIIVEKIRNS